MFESKKIYEVSSPISGKVAVWEDRWLRRLVIWGVVQSVYRLRGWEQGYWSGMIPDRKISSALILGMGGGTVANLLRKKWPDVRVVAYEIDPVIAQVAKKYFNLDPKTEVRIEDYVGSFKTPEKFDLIVVDLYFGSKFLEDAKKEEFFRKVSEKLAPDGAVSVNRVSEAGEGELKRMDQVMEKVFKKTWQVRVGGNIIYWGQNWI